MPTTCLIYVRISGAQQSEHSIDTQLAACRAYAEREGWLVAGVYDDALSGAVYRERPALTALRARVAAGGVDVVLAYALDRLSRNAAHVFILDEELRQHGCRLAFATEQYEDTPVGRLIRSVMAFVAEVEREKIVERSVRGKRGRIAAGKLPRFGRELYGYRRDHAANVRVIVPAEAAVVRRIYREYAAGTALRALAAALERDGIPAPHGGPRWGHSTLARMLAEPAYAGETILWRWQRPPATTRARTVTRRPAEDWLRLPPGTTPALVERATWDAVQARLAARDGSAARNQRRFALLRGLARCLVCGCPLYVEVSKGKRYYRCASRDRRRAGACGARMVPADELDAWVWSVARARIGDPAVVAAGRRAVEGETQPDARGAAREITAARRRVAALEREQDRLLAAYRQSEDVVWEVLERQLAALERERRELAAALVALEERATAGAAQSRARRELADWCRDVAANLDTLDDEGRRQLLVTLGVRVQAAGREWEYDDDL